MPQPAEGHVTTDDGVRLFFETRGDGPGAVAIPNGIPLLEDFAPLAEGRTLVCYDPRSRGRSDAAGDGSQPAGIERDVLDLEAVRRHLGVEKIAVLGHSYAGVMAVLYAMRFPGHADRVVQLAPLEPRPGTRYPAHLTNADATVQEVFGRLAMLEQERGSVPPEEFCRKFWSMLRVLYVADPRDADRIRWGRCDLPNERGFMTYWTKTLLPSLRALDLGPAALAAVAVPVLVVHGSKDRSAPYGGGRDWALRLPQARC